MNKTSTVILSVVPSENHTYEFHEDLFMTFSGKRPNSSSQQSGNLMFTFSKQSPS